MSCLSAFFFVFLVSQHSSSILSQCLYDVTSFTDGFQTLQILTLSR